MQPTAMRPHIRGNAKEHLSSRNKPSFTASKGIFRSTICGKRRTVWQSAIYKSTAIAPGYAPTQASAASTTRARQHPTDKAPGSIRRHRHAHRPCRANATDGSKEAVPSTMHHSVILRWLPQKPSKTVAPHPSPRDERGFTTPPKSYKHRQQPPEHRFFMFFTHILQKKFGSLPK